MSTLQKYANFVALLVLCSITISMSCKSEPRRKPPAITCNTNCRGYNQTVCDKLITPAARQAFFLKRALETESVAQRQFASSSCDISRSVWNKTSVDLMTKIRTAENPDSKEIVQCNIKVIKTRLNCIAYVKLFECAIGRIQVAYGNHAPCLQDWQHGSWSKVVGAVGEFAADLDYLYESGSPLSPRKSSWKNVKSSLAALKKTLEYVGVSSSTAPGGGLPLPPLGIIYDYIDEVDGLSAEDY